MMNFQILSTIVGINGLAKQTQARIKRRLVPSIGEDRQDRVGLSNTSIDPMDLSG
jgi:hypothetical protein